MIDADDDYVRAEPSHEASAIGRLIGDRFVYNADGTTMVKEAFVRQVVSLQMVGQTVRERSAIVEGDVGIIFATTDLRFAAPGGTESGLRCPTPAPASGRTACGG